MARFLDGNKMLGCIFIEFMREEKTGSSVKELKELSCIISDEMDDETYTIIPIDDYRIGNFVCENRDYLNFDEELSYISFIEEKKLECKKAFAKKYGNYDEQYRDYIKTSLELTSNNKLLVKIS